MSTPRPKKKLGPVALVAAGPGDPELLTLRAAELLRSAARIIADFDAVELARPFEVEEGRWVVGGRAADQALTAPALRGV